MNEITTIIAKTKILLARAGKQQLPAIKMMAFGNGGVDPEGVAIKPPEGQQELNHELYRKDIDSIETVSDTQMRYSCTLNEDELNGEEISELGLVDASGDLVMIKNFKSKGKDADFKITFTVNDIM